MTRTAVGWHIELEVAGARALNELATQLLTKAHDEIDEESGRTSHTINV